MSRRSFTPAGGDRAGQPLEPGSDQHVVLRLLAAGVTMGADVLLAGLPQQQGGRGLMTRREFRLRVLRRLEGRALAKNVGRLQWRITPQGRARLLEIEPGLPPPAAAAAAPPSTAAATGEAAAVEGDSIDAGLLTTGRPCRYITAADGAPCVSRAGADEALALPSRRGSRLYYRDGRVTDLAGNCRVEAGPAEAA